MIGLHRKNALLLAGLLAVTIPQLTLAQEAHGIKLSESSSISPYIEASFTYDDNVPLRPPGKELDDTYIDIALGLSFLRQTETDNLTMQAWAQRREYFEYTELNDWTWQERVEYVLGNPDRLQFRFKQRYGHLSDYEFTQSDASAPAERREATMRLIETRTRRTQRDILDFEAAVARETRRLNVEVKAAYAAVDYERSNHALINRSGFALYNWSEYHADPFIGFRVSEKTMISLSGVIGVQETDNDLERLEFLRGLVGILYTPTEKTRFNIGLGQQSTAVPSDPSLDTSGIYFDTKIMWMATERMSVQAYGRNEYQPTSAFESNTKLVSQGSVGLVYEISRRVMCTAGASYRADDYTAPIGGVDALETHKGLQLKLNMQGKKRRIGVYLKGRYEMFESNIQDDYNQLRLMIGASLAM